MRNSDCITIIKSESMSNMCGSWVVEGRETEQAIVSKDNDKSIQFISRNIKQFGRF